MRIAYFSDCHIETRAHTTRVPWCQQFPLDLGPNLNALQGQVDAIILAGDIGTYNTSFVGWATPQGVNVLHYLQQVQEFLQVPVFFVPGNHEYYRSDFSTARDAMLNANIPNVTIMDRHTDILQIGDEKVRIIGATLWTDYKLVHDQVLSMFDASRYMNDFKVISNGNRKLEPKDCQDEHTLSRDYIRNELKTIFDGPTIVITHHVPHSVAKNPFFPIDISSANFYSDCDDLIELAENNNVSFIFGHHHWCIDTELYGVKLLSAQVGYPRENTGWSGIKILEV